MNERIKELVGKAKFMAEESINKKISANDELYAFSEKFAELIVEDMYKKVIASILITDVVMEEKSQVPTSEDYIRAINKDFGVE
jgi:hypothetical protein